MSKRSATHHSFTTSTSRRKKQKLQHYEPVCPVIFEKFKEYSLIQLIRSIDRFYHTDWSKFPQRQFYYGCCKQIFVRRICKSGNLGKLAFETIEKIKNKNGRLIDDILDFSVFYEIDNVVNILFDD